MLGAIWNRWTTSRRFQQRWTVQNRCLLGCPGEAEDSIEHYAYCRTVWAAARRALALGSPDPGDGVPRFLLASSTLVMAPPRCDHARVALLVYATYRATNAARPLGGYSAEFAEDAIAQYVREGARGCRAVLRLVQ